MRLVKFFLKFIGLMALLAVNLIAQAIALATATVLVTLILLAVVIL